MGGVFSSSVHILNLFQNVKNFFNSNLRFNARFECIRRGG